MAACNAGVRVEAGEGEVYSAFAVDGAMAFRICFTLPQLTVQPHTCNIIDFG